jgi:hypothetical protein
MKHTFVLIFAIGLLLLGCSPAVTPAPTQEPAEAPTLEITEPPASPVPTSGSLPAPNLEQQAPICTVNPLEGACSAPKVTTLSKFCVSKIPYTVLGIPPSATFEPLDENLKCKDEKVWGGVRQLSCTGQQSYSYEIKVCDTTCSVTPLESGSAKCPAGYGYSEAANCCWMPSTDETGCTIFKLDIGACK